LESHIPVGLDGTANGLQHYSAMLRDPVGAAAVNMTTTDRPSDIYATIASAVMDRLVKHADEQIASLWIASGLVTRSIVKRPVMTLPYGATRYGFVDQILQTLRGDDKTWQTARKVFGLAHVRIRVAVQYLSSIIWDVLGDTVGGALGAMSWLQKASAAVSSQTGGPVAWTVPLTGFPAHQEYFKARRSQIETRLNGTVLKPTVWTATNKPNTAKIKNAIAPNVVHSLDAAAMMATTVACAARGVPAFSMIHDSYACHAECVPVMADCIRTSIIDLYFERDTLAGLADYWRSLGADIPDPPKLGTYDIRDVRHAPFFFA
jgi:DNA-directed RNA polymerase